MKASSGSGEWPRRRSGLVIAMAIIGAGCGAPNSVGSFESSRGLRVARADQEIDAARGQGRESTDRDEREQVGDVVEAVEDRVTVLIFEAELVNAVAEVKEQGKRRGEEQ